MPYADKQKRLDYIKEWRQAHPEKVREYNAKVGTSTEAVRAWRARNPEKARESARVDAANRRKRMPYLNLKGNYRLSHEQAKFLYEKMQAAVCEICGNPDRRVVFDHNHTTGSFRGFLCTSCNSGIGQFQDNPALLEAAISYLRSR